MDMKRQPHRVAFFAFERAKHTIKHCGIYQNKRETVCLM